MASKQTTNPRMLISGIDDYISPYKSIEKHSGVCYLYIYFRLPSIKHPSRVWNLRRGTGHVFISLQKISDGDTVSRYFGFYPRNTQPIILSFRAVPGELSDNRFHSYDASFRIRLKSQQLKELLAFIRLKAAGSSFCTYQNNCVHFALSAIYRVVPKSSFDKVQVYHKFLPKSCATPGDLYETLSVSKSFERIQPLK